MANHKHLPPQTSPEKKTKENDRADAVRTSAANQQFFKEYALLLDEVKKHPYIKKASYPQHIVPMQATEAERAFNHPDWLFEMKLNGIRAQIFPATGATEKFRIKSEKKLSTDVLEVLALALQQWPVQAVVDGEIIIQGIMAGEGSTNENNKAVYFYAYDLLWLEEYDLTELPLLHRKQILQQLLPESGCLCISDHIDEWGEDFYYLAQSSHQPGIVARHKFAPYQNGATSDWLYINVATKDEAAKSKLQPAESEAAEEETDEKILHVDGHALKLLRPQSSFHKKEQVLKRDIICYYLDVAEVLLPYLTDRPLLMEHPSKLLLKDLHSEKWINSFEQEDESKGRQHHYAIATGAASLAFLANHGHYTFRPWHSRVNTLAYPDWCILSIESPGGLKKVIETATVLHQVLRSFDIPSYPKTAEKGIDVYIPLGAKFNFEQSNQLAQMLVSMLVEELPIVTPEKIENGKRQGQVHVSYRGNRAKAAAPAPYTLLTAGGISVSTPLDWEEVKPGLDPQSFHVKNIPARLQERGDHFLPVLNKGVDLNHLLKGLATLLTDSDYLD